MAIRYRGFSTVDRVKKFHLVDFELVRQDLINHFNIHKGQKLMNPDFGTIIWGLLYEPMTADLKAILVADVTRIVKYDPRLRADSVIINEFEQGLKIEIELTFLPGNFSSSVQLEFNSNSEQVAVV
jgi:phage baseplate assembly protein W